MIIFARTLITIFGLCCILISYTLWDITREFFNPFYVRELFTISVAISGVGFIWIAICDPSWK
jgi:hypothetical protein